MKDAQTRHTLTVQAEDGAAIHLDVTEDDRLVLRIDDPEEQTESLRLLGEDAKLVGELFMEAARFRAHIS